ncbi:MAG: methyltransferase type 11 [Epsilonproteobacteria bacterium]|nr:MAG: methyltransferase type 11 [Campylobacterota bacterium]RLA67254.1 MAG: methyltransferase type 11 [Campylobacterota bacterium]
METDTTKQNVKEYYGDILQSTKDLKTNACCTTITYPDLIKESLGKIHDEVLNKYYGCGLTIPTDLEGLKVLDLGSGSGRDCFILSDLVGEQGEVVGVDMTPSQLAVANKYIPYHTEKFGHKNPNVSFHHGEIENLNALGLKDNYFDLIVSNCVINLSTDKRAVFAEAFRTLKEGGELYFSDVYADRRIPQELINDPVLYGECLSGALYVNDFTTLVKSIGFIDPRVVTKEELLITNKEVQEKVGDIKFYSITYRLFKLSDLAPFCEDYHQSATYKGTIPGSPDSFELDGKDLFKKDEQKKVCGNTYLMLKNSRFKDHFSFTGDFSKHFGLYKECSEPVTVKKTSCC